MSWQLVARKDFADSLRSRMLWGILGASMGLVLVIVLAFGANSTGATAADFMALFGGLGGQLVVPIIALVAGYMAVVGERQSGSMLVLFGLPHSRRDIVVGKLLGRSAVVALATLGAFVVGGVLIPVLYGSLPLGTYATFTLLTVLLGVAFTAIAVGISAAAATRGRAMAGAIGSYLLFMMLWEPVVAGVHYLLEGTLAGLRAPAWYFLLKRLSPGFAYLQAVNARPDVRVRPLVGWSSAVETVPPSARSQPELLALSNRVAGDLPFYLEDWFAVVVLLGWVGVAFAVGYWRFRNVDLT